MRGRLRPLLALLGVTAALAVTPAHADHNFFLVGFDVSTNYGDPVTFKAQLLRPEPEGDCTGPCPVRNAQVDFYVDGRFLGTDLTNAGGFAFVRVIAQQDWHVGLHAVRAQYDRSTNPATPATVNETLTITKEVTAVIARKGYLEAQLLTDDNLPLSGFPVRFFITTPAGPRDVCTAFSDASGSARCIPVTGAGFSSLNLAQTQYSASFDGNSDYVASSGSANLV